MIVVLTKGDLITAEQNGHYKSELYKHIKSKGYSGLMCDMVDISNKNRDPVKVQRLKNLIRVIASKQNGWETEECNRPTR